MKERVTLLYPYVLAAALPLAGLLLAGLWASQKRTYDATLMAGAALLGLLIWTAALTA